MTSANSNSFDLAWLLSPLEPQAFFSAYWEERPLHLQQRVSDYYQELLSAGALEQFINTADLRYPALQLAKAGHYYAAEAYTREIRHGSLRFAGVPDLARVAAEYRDGATLTLPALHRTWGPLQSLCARLEAQFDHAAHANAYLTPANASGFAPHYDIHEVFVLQIAGHKRWSLYEPPITLPYRSQPFDPNSYRPGALIATLDLHPGDLLYLPRGYVHTTATSDQYSAHVTIGITVYTWADLLRDHLPSPTEHPTLRKALPPGFAHRAELRPALRQGVLDAMAELGIAASPDPALEAFLQRVRGARSPRTEALRIDTRVIDLETTLRPPAREAYRLHSEAAHLALEFAGRRYLLPPAAAPLLQAIVAGERFRPRDLPDADEAARLGVSRYLYEIGFLSLER
jgi:ribosomal protein L16 Arg81 hydroxylase